MHTPKPATGASHPWFKAAPSATSSCSVRNGRSTAIASRCKGVSGMTRKRKPSACVACGRHKRRCGKRFAVSLYTSRPCGGRGGGGGQAHDGHLPGRRDGVAGRPVGRRPEVGEAIERDQLAPGQQIGEPSAHGGEMGGEGARWECPQRPSKVSDLSNRFQQRPPFRVQ
jgi:hypothetical protein